MIEAPINKHQITNKFQKTMTEMLGFGIWDLGFALVETPEEAN